MQVRAGSRAMVRWERTAQKSESPPMPYAYAGRQKASGPSTREPLLRGSGQTDSLPKHRATSDSARCFKTRVKSPAAQTNGSRLEGRDV